MSITTIIPTLPNPPLRSDPTNFAERADAFLGALPAFGVALNSFSTEANSFGSTVNNYATIAQAAADAAAYSANVTGWVSGATYSAGATVWSPTDFKTYRNKTGTNTTTDPQTDSTNWQLLVGEGDVSQAGNNTFTGSNTFTQTIIAPAVQLGLANIAYAAAGETTVATIPAAAAYSNVEFVMNYADQTIGGVKNFTGKVLLSNGLASSPSIAFSSDGLQDTGFYWGGTDGTFMVANNGVKSGEFQSGGNLVMVGNVTGYSDERLKVDWTNIPQNFVFELATVKAGTYSRVDNGARQAGVSAQSLQQILPEAVLENPDGYLSVAYGNAALYACVALAKEVVHLKQQISKLLEE